MSNIGSSGVFPDKQFLLNFISASPFLGFLTDSYDNFVIGLMVSFCDGWRTLAGVGTCRSGLVDLINALPSLL